MTDQILETKVMALQDLVQRYADEGRFEFVEGEVISLSPALSYHGEIANNLAFIINSHALNAKIGKAFVETVFVKTLPANANWVTGSRIPDVMYYTYDRLEAYKAATPNWQDIPFVLVPDFAAEVVSPNDAYSEVFEKVLEYLDDGVQVVWVIDPKTRTIAVHQPGDAQHQVFTETQSVSLSPAIANFSVDCAQVFDFN